MIASVAALYVQRGGVYWDRQDVDAWDKERDAMQYCGALPVVAHPPCARWCRLSKFIEKRYGYAVGDDGGTFASALASVRRFGGVLEHPAWSMAWAAHGLIAPPKRGWHRDIDGGWTCEVSQSAYGHRAKKLTWLYYVGRTPPPALNWSSPQAKAVVSRFTNKWDNGMPKLSSKEASATPAAFANLLLSIARDSGGCP